MHDLGAIRSRLRSYTPKLVQRPSLALLLTLIVFAVMMIPVCGLGLYSYVTFKRNLTGEVERYLRQNNIYIKEVLTTRLQLIDEKSMLLLSHPFVQATLKKSPAELTSASVSLKTQFQRELETLFMFNYAWEHKLFNEVFIFKDQVIFFYLLRNYMYHKVIRAFQIVYRRSQDMPQQFALYPPVDDTANIYLVRNINRVGTLDNLGKLIISINVQEIPAFIQQNTQYSAMQTIIYDSKGTLLMHSDPRMVGHPIPFPVSLIQEDTNYRELSYQNQTYVVSTSDLGVFALRMLIMIPKAQAFSRLKTSIQRYVVICGFVLAFSLIIAVLISNIATTAIKQMTTTIEQVKHGDFEARMPAFAFRELQQLQYVFNSMTERINFLIKDVYEKQLLLKEMELKTLHAQINPHFLFNVLETISWHARIAKNEAIYSMITTLGKLLRANLALTKIEYITIRQELEYVDFYVSLQKMRFPDRLNVIVQIEQDAFKELLIPKFIIQPLVENAIEHGLQNMRGDWEVQVMIQARQHDLAIRVTDNGAGFDVRQIPLEGDDPVVMREYGHTRIGLANIQKRLTLLYGEAHGLTLRSIIGAGAEITITLPLDRLCARTVEE